MPEQCYGMWNGYLNYRPDHWPANVTMDNVRNFLDEEKIREIVREEIKEALKELAEGKKS